MFAESRWFKRAALVFCISILTLTGLAPSHSAGDDLPFLPGGKNDYGIYKVHVFFLVKSRLLIKRKKRRSSFVASNVELHQYTGTGFLVNDKNLVVTNNHLLELD